MVAAVGNRSFILDIECWRCRNVYSIIVNRQDIMDYASGIGNASTIFHYLSANERELIISQTCGDCFDAMFAPLDSDD